jgi:hypothetical protein
VSWVASGSRDGGRGWSEPPPGGGVKRRRGCRDAGPPAGSTRRRREAGIAPLVEVPAERQAAEAARARASEAGERARTRYVFIAPLCIIAFWALAGSALYAAAAATTDPERASVLVLAAPMVTVVGDAACLLAWFIRAAERDLL